MVPLSHQWLELNLFASCKITLHRLLAFPCSLSLNEVSESPWLRSGYKMSIFYFFWLWNSSLCKLGSKQTANTCTIWLLQSVRAAIARDPLFGLAQAALTCRVKTMVCLHLGQPATPKKAKSNFLTLRSRITFLELLEVYWGKSGGNVWVELPSNLSATFGFLFFLQREGWKPFLMQDIKRETHTRGMLVGFRM